MALSQGILDLPVCPFKGSRGEDIPRIPSISWNVEHSGSRLVGQFGRNLLPPVIAGLPAVEWLETFAALKADQMTGDG